MILWCDGGHDPAENMRRDAALLAAAEDGAPPVLRLFRFDPHGITLGHAQDPAAELDLERCRADGVGWARRPTGGRAIFHAEEWTYSLAAPLGDPDWGGSLSDAYEKVSDLLLRSLVRLGVPARRVGAVPMSAPDAQAGAGRGRPGRTSGPAPAALVGEAGTRGGGASPPCFASRTRHEIALGPGKLVGSAQRRTRGALLQQGSVLLGRGHARLADYVRIPDERRAEWRAALERASADASAWLGASAPLERWADALLAELPPGARRADGAEGGFRLTPPESGSYTARSG